MRLRFLPLAAAFSLLLASCTDRPTSLDPSGDVPADLLQPSLSVLDGTQPDGNAHFFWLSPLGSAKKGFDGVADGNLYPTVEICPRNTAGDGCEAGPALASFTRDSGEDKHRVKVDDKDEYFVHWHMTDFSPARDGVYRIRVLIQGQELGHADVIALRQRDIKAYTSQGGELIPVSDQGSFKIAFRMEEGVLEDQFCDFDGDTDVQDCQAAQEVPGDGIPTTVQVTGTTTEGQVVAAVITAPDGVFTDVNGDPIPNVVITAEVELDPPSDDVFPDAQEFPFFVEVNTYPGNVYIDPNGPGVTVVVCQDEEELLTRGVAEPLHSQLILYKVSDTGTTRRLVSTFGAPECDTAPAPAPAPGLLGMLKRSTAKVLGALGPEPLVARRRLHGGLNTVITRDVSLDEAFSTFGAAMGPNAAQTSAVLPASGAPGTPVPITIQVRNALGENFVMAGDTLEITVRGANPTATFKATDAGTGIHTASYTPTTPGVDSIDIVLIRADGIGLGPIGGSPYTIQVVAPTQVTNTNDAGAGSLRQAILNANLVPGRDSISFAIPGGGPQTIALASPLPTITGEVMIDGFSQPGYDGAPYVEVAGTGVTGYGFDVQASNVTLRGLAITGFSADGIFVLQTMSGVLIEDNYIGTDRAGSSGKGNQNAGIRYRGANGAIRGNLISGNTQAGILFELAAASSNVVENNTIGLDPAGTAALPNGGNGITMYAGTPNNVIQNNLISGNGGVGIDIQHSGALAPVTGTQILGNTLGLDVNGGVLRKSAADLIDGATNFGPVLRGNSQGGIRVNNAPGTVIGAPGAGNTISGNTGRGIYVLGPTVAPALVVRANIIGLDPSGSAERGNTIDGITVASGGVVVGGPSAADRNVISGNHSEGVETAGASGVVIEGNYVGVDASGTVALGNGLYFGPGNPGCCHTGIFVRSGGNVVRGNVVSGNWLGIRSGDSGTPGNLIENNLVGTDASGTAPLPNLTEGIGLYGDKSGTQVRGNTVRFNGGMGIWLVEGTEDALIGGTGPGDGNVVRDNAGPGVAVGYNLSAGDTRNTIRSNQITGNGGLGIDLASNGVTANDGLDADGGPNGLVNKPELVSALNGMAPGFTQVQLTLNAAPNTVYDVEFFDNAACGGSGVGPGESPLLLATSAATDGSGQLTYSVNLPSVANGRVITATATDPSGSTSEFSGCVTVASGSPPPVVTSVVPSPFAGGTQGLAFFGTNMNNTVWTFTNTSTLTTYGGFTFLSPSTSTTQYVLPSSLPPGTYSVTVTDVSTALTSAPVPLTIGAQNGTPTLVGVFNGVSDGAPAASIASASTVYIQGYGIWTTGVDACFTQGSAPSAGPSCAGTLVSNTSAYSGAAIGIRAEINAPALASGPVWIQIRSGNSDFTAPVLLNVP